MSAKDETPPDGAPDAQVDALLRALPWPDHAFDDDTVEAVAAAEALDDALEAQLIESAELRELWAQRDATVSPMLLKRMEKRAPTKSRAPLFGGLALAAALLIGLSVTVLDRGPDLPDYAVELGGTAKLTRSTHEAPIRAVFRPESAVRITLRPATRVEGTPKLAAFLEQDGRLQRVDDRGRVEAEPGGLFIFSAPGARLFGDQPGRFTLYLAIGDDPAALVGETVESARADADRWHQIDVEYQTGTP